MKKMFISLMIMIWGTLAVYSQNSNPELAKYLVQKGDNTWDLSALRNNDPLQYKKIIQDNPFLEGRIRNEGPGKIFVDLVAGQDVLMLTPEQKALIHPVAPTPVKKVVTVAPVVKEAKKIQLSTTDIFLAWWTTSGWKWLFAIVFVILLIFLISALAKALKYTPKVMEEDEEIFENPITAGPPQIEGGATDANIDAIIINRRPGSQIERRFRGRLYSEEAISEYGDNVPRRVRLNGEVGYQVIAIRPNGERETTHTLMACANDVRAGGGLRGDIRFVAEAEVVNGEARPLNQTPTPAILTPNCNEIAFRAIQTAMETGRGLTLVVENNNLSIDLAEPKILPLPLHQNGELPKELVIKHPSADITPGLS